ncbi:MAG: methyltransferase domain-containing protein [Myxococcales bacterium]|nr:methyltransferase domain-containing protein [Myxococcales bacterium]
MARGSGVAARRGDAPTPCDAPRDASARAIVEHFARATADYDLWSPGLNMHFGFLRRGLSPFRLEPMLEEMNLQVRRRLGAPSRDGARVLDLGCGVGASARSMARGGHLVTGLTITPSQVQHARLLNERAGLSEQVEVRLQDYTRADELASGAFTGAYCIESACYARGLGKRDLVRETARLLRPGARFVVADAFYRVPPARLPWPARALLRRIAGRWAVESFAGRAAFATALREHGFRDIVFEDVSLRVVASVAHVPVTVARFLGRAARAGRAGLHRERWRNVEASLLTALVPLASPWFRYYLVSATRGA